MVYPGYKHDIMLSCLVKRLSKDNYIRVVSREAKLIAKMNDDMEKYEKKAGTFEYVWNWPINVQWLWKAFNPHLPVLDFICSNKKHYEDCK